MILVVDDDEDVREMVKSALETHGYVVRDADGGSAALELLATEHPCLVLLDLVMPGIDGWQVIEQMKARAIHDVPVCVVTALPERSPTDVAATLRKPFALGELLAVAERYCTPEPHAARG